MLEDLPSNAKWRPVDSANLGEANRQKVRKIHVNGSKLRTQGNRNNLIQPRGKPFFLLKLFSTRSI